jgi:hypothetical protein
VKEAVNTILKVKECRAAVMFVSLARMNTQKRIMIGERTQTRSPYLMLLLHYSLAP